MELIDFIVYKNLAKVGDGCSKVYHLMFFTVISLETTYFTL